MPKENKIVDPNIEQLASQGSPSGLIEKLTHEYKCKPVASGGPEHRVTDAIVRVGWGDGKSTQVGDLYAFDPYQRKLHVDTGTATFELTDATNPHIKWTIQNVAMGDLSYNGAGPWNVRR